MTSDPMPDDGPQLKLGDVQIADKFGRLTPLFPKKPPRETAGIIRCQQKLLGVMAQQRKAGHPCRIIILKARQLGMSTVVDCLFYVQVATKPHQTAMVCAHETGSSATLFSRIRKAHDLADDKRELDNDSLKEIRWGKQHGSLFQVKTARNKNLGRSMTIQYVHASEVAFWEYQTESMTSVLQCVPNSIETAVVIESTANGVGDQFHSRCMAAKTAEEAARTGQWGGYILVFFSWLDNPEEYALPVPDDYNWETESDEIKEDEAKLTRLGATPEQLFWRRYKIHEDMRDNVDMFKQEFPATPEDAFLQSGRRAIPAVVTERHRSTIEIPREARFLRDSLEQCGVRSDYGRGIGFEWKIWRTPKEGHDYAIGVDVAEGRLSDMSDARSDPDFSTVGVIDRKTLTTAASFRGRLDADLLGEQAMLAAMWYNWAWTAVEANAVGQATVLYLKRRAYPYLYQRKVTPDKMGGEEKAAYGWLTTGATRDILIDKWLAACRPDYIHGIGFPWESKMVCLDEMLATEEETFVYDKKGKRQHRSGCHDDVLFAYMIANEVHITCPRNMSGSGLRMRPAIRGIGFAGGIDDFSDLEDEAKMLVPWMEQAE